MEPRFQTSFIPKKPITVAQKATLSSGESVNIFTLITEVIFVFVLLVMGGLYFYDYTLNKQIEEINLSINEAKNTFQLDKIQELLDANSRMVASKELLEKHVVVSKLLFLLQEETLKNMRFSDFSYKNENNALVFSMKVEAVSYNALASQADLFSKNEFIKNPRFSDFSLTDNGRVNATFFGEIDQKLVSYKKAMESLSSNQ